MKRAKSFTIKAETGFIETEALLVGAIGLFLLLAVAGAMTSMINFQKRADQSSESQLFARELALALKSEDNCTTALAGLSLPASTTYSLSGATTSLATTATGLAVVTLPERPVTFSVPIAAATVTVEPGFQPSESLRVASVGLLENSQYGEVQFTQKNPLVPAGMVVKEKLAIIRLRTERLNNGVAELNPAKDIAVKVLVDSSGTILGCNVTASAALTCVQMGGTWNPNAPTADQRCIPKYSCQYGGTYSEAPPDKGGYPNAMTGFNTCPDASFTPQRTGTVTYASACGKTCVNNTYYPIYTCTRCGDGVGLQPLAANTVTSATDANITGNDAVGTDGSTISGSLFNLQNILNWL